MLKRLVILGLFVAVLQTPTPLPREKPTRPSNGSGNANGNSQGKNGVSSPPVPIVDLGQPPVTTEHAGEVGAQETKHSVTLTSVPPLTINDKKKSFLDHVYDWGPWFFGLFLAIAGGVQLKLLRVTWKAIREQKAEMSIQTGVLKDSVAAAKDSAKAANDQIQMVKDKERARISVSVRDDEFEISPAYSFDAIIITIANDGTTSAFNVRAKGEVFGQPSEDLPPMRPFIPLKVPSVIRANGDPTQAEVILVQDIDLSGVEDSPIPYFFHIGGIVEYDDVFGESHETTFRYRLKVNGVLQIPDSKSVKIRSWGGWKRTPKENRAT